MRNLPYALVAALTLARFADEWAAFLPAGSLEAIRGGLSLTYAQAAMVLVALPAGGLLGNVFVIAADYVSRRVVASLGAAAYGLAMAGFGVAHSLPLLLICAFVWGAASDAFVHGCEVALVDLAEDDLPRLLARMNAWAAIGDLLGPLTLAGAIALGLGWRGAFLGVGGVMLAYAAWLGFQKLPPPHPPKNLPRPMAGMLAVLRDRRVLYLAVILGLLSLLDEPLAGFMIAYLERVRGLGVGVATAVVMAIIVGWLAGFAGYERLAGERPVRAVLLTTAAVAAAALPPAIFLPAPVLQALAGVVFGVASAVFYTALEAMVLSLRPGQAGAVSAVVSTVGMLGIGFPTLVGAVADAHGLGAGLALYALLPPIILALVWLDRRRGSLKP